ncbi:MAG: phosphopantothenoylcysteine decarboxylase [Synechococcaceae cyanobacterium]|nr:phosphopantothenoylcysteine decarboxylase [Synechococcaceae cyanobacterium]
MSSYDAWDFSPPRSQPIGDHDVSLQSRHLAGRRIALLVSGGIAALRSPDLARALRSRGAEVTAFCTEEALHYVGRQALEWATCRPVVSQLTWRAEHLSDAHPFDAWLLAPATYNTIGKLAAGIADTVVTAALASALGRLAQGRTAVLVAPTMHGSLHNPMLERNCRQLAALGVQLVPPRDAYGKHNLPAQEVLVAAVCRALSTSPLRGRRLLVTGGPTPVAIDGVRRIVNRFTGQLATAISAELALRGADLTFLLGEGSQPAPSWLPCTPVHDYDDYRHKVLTAVRCGLDAGVFSAGVADYRPRAPRPGKIASGEPELRLDLVPTAKVIDAVGAADPSLPIVSFKYLEGVAEEELLAVARARLARSSLVVANRGEEVRGLEQTAWLVSEAGELRLEGKGAIAASIADHLETLPPHRRAETEHD